VSHLSQGAFYRRWVWANGWAELLGLGATLLLGWFGTRAFSPADASPLIILAGAFAAIVFGTLLEGILIGFAQARVLHDRLAALAPRSWILATASGAAVAWALGMIPSTVINLLNSQPASPMSEFPDSPQYLLAAAMGMVLGVILGSSQWRVLRHHVPHAGFWVGANAVAWTIGMPLIFLGMDTLSENASVTRIGLTVLATCLAAGLAVGAIHGWALIRLLRQN